MRDWSFEGSFIGQMSATAYKLSKQEKQRLADRINYYRTMPAQILKTAGDLDAGVRVPLRDFVTHDIKSVMVGGRIMLLNCKSQS